MSLCLSWQGPSVEHPLTVQPMAGAGLGLVQAVLGKLGPWHTCKVM